MVEESNYFHAQQLLPSTTYSNAFIIEFIYFDYIFEFEQLRMWFLLVAMV